MRRVIDAVKAAGVDKNDIKTQDVSVSANYVDEGRIDGYSARKLRLVKIHDLSKAGPRSSTPPRTPARTRSTARR